MDNLKQQLLDNLYRIERHLGFFLAWFGAAALWMFVIEVYWLGLICFYFTLQILNKWNVLVIKIFLRKI